MKKCKIHTQNKQKEI